VVQSPLFERAFLLVSSVRKDFQNLSLPLSQWQGQAPLQFKNQFIGGVFNLKTIIFYF
jgi:hypothetical protein